MNRATCAAVPRPCSRWARGRVALRALLALAVPPLWAGACGHTTTATDPAAAEREDEGKDDEAKDDKRKSNETRQNAKPSASKPPASKAADRSDGTRASEPDDSNRGRGQSSATDIPVAASPAGLLKPGAAEKIEEKLVAKGLLERDKRSGKLGGATSTALRRFQRDANIAETGVPDHETIRRLGLSPDDVFRAAE